MKLESALKKKNILVIGDVMLDMYYIGDVNRISPEAPVPVFRKKNERCVLGGAANVAANLIAAGQNVFIMSVVGNDPYGELLVELFNKQKIDTKFVLKTNRVTTIKTRFMASNNQQVMRLDIEDTSELLSEECEKLLGFFEDNIEKFDLVVFSDYLKGLMTYEFTQGIIKIANKYKVNVIIDVKDPKYVKYTGAYLLKPNLIELHSLTGMPTDTEEDIIKASRKLLIECDNKFVLTTCGARGMILVGAEITFLVKSVGKEVFDVTGAGDTTISYLAACIANNIEIKQAVEISNFAAGLQVAKVGTTAVSVQEVQEFLISKKQGVIHKLINFDELKDFRLKNQDKKIVFTNGCFDILHVGHIRYLQETAALGDILIVGLNSDNSVRRLKGIGRPINTENDRAELLCALEYVDYVVVFEEETPYNLISLIQPDVLAKGGDYRIEEVVGRDIVEQRGGNTILINLVEGKSTTSLIDRIKN